jgi:probable rRNA maturation factor
MLCSLEREGAELSIVLVNDDLIQELNRQYRGKDAVTDVLSFAMSEGEFGDVNPMVLGDVVISVPTARRQAHRFKREVFDQVVFLLAHGLLHLVGFDHATDEQEREMNRRTRWLLSAGVVTNRK